MTEISGPATQPATSGPSSPLHDGRGLPLAAKLVAPPGGGTGGGRVPPSFAWWVVLCLVGLDYFSTLAYLPSIAVTQMMRFSIPALAPIAAVGVVLVTLL